LDQLSAGSGGEAGIKAEKAFEEFNKSWMVYWDAYVDLQNQLYESIKTAREVGQISRDLDSALSKLEELEAALSLEKEKCKRLQQATDVLLEGTRRTKEELAGTKK
jgi:hypothetical protein